MMKRKLKIGFLDYGTFLSTADRFARDGHDVMYYCPRSSAFPTNDRDIIGTGIEGITKVLEDEFYAKLKECDFVVFPYINDGGKQVDIVNQGIPVFGTRNGDMLERNRKLLKQALLSVGLPIVPFDGKQEIKEVIGFDAVRSMLQQTKDKWMKFSDLRGYGETRHHIDYEDSEEWLFEWSHLVGVQRHDFSVIFEDSIEGVEIGGDLWYTNKTYLPLGLYGIEDKDASYSCRIIAPEKIPALVRDVNNRMIPIFAPYDPRSVISTEMRVPNKTTACVIDLTLRHPSPPTEINNLIWKNLPYIYFAVARGESIMPETTAKCAASLVLYSARVQNEITPVSFPSKYRNNVSLQNYCIDKNGKYKCIPQDKGDVLGLVAAEGRTLEEAQVEVLEIAETIKAEGIHFDKATFDKVDEDIDKARKLGLW